MRALTRFLARLRASAARRRDEDRLNQEIEEHLAIQVEENLRAGWSPTEARRQAVLKFGPVEAIKEDYRGERGLPLLETVLRDARYGLRQIRKSPGFALTAIAILALGIAATTAVYSVAKAVIFAPLPFPNPERLVYIFEANIGDRFQPGVENLITVRPGVYQDWRQQSRSFESMAAVQHTQATLLDGDRASVIDGLVVDYDFFTTLGVPARFGRNFLARDYATGNSRVVILADRMWRKLYNADPSIIGREILLDGAAYRVIGVMPAGFLPTGSASEPQFWLPLHWDPSTKHSLVLWGNWVYARLKNGVTLTRAQSEIDSIAARMRAAYPGDDGLGAIVAPLDGYLSGGHERMFVLLLVAVGLVLLIACANVANLFLARALEREREFAVRSALGASRTAIFRQVLLESLVIAVAGGMLGAVLSLLLTQPVLALLPAASKIPRLDQVQVDTGVLSFTLLISIIAGLLFGIAPAIRAGDISVGLNARGRGNSLGRNEGRLSDALVIAEIAFSLVLLIGGGLLTRTFLKLLHTDPGFHPAQSVAFRISVPKNRYGFYEIGGKNAPRQRLYDRLEKSVQSIPGVKVAGLTGKLPLRQFWNPWGVSIEGLPPALGRDGRPMISKRWSMPMQGEVSEQPVSPGYFAALGIPLIRGRVFDERDRPDAPMTAVINEATARKFFPNEDPIGRRIAIDMTSYALRMTIVGIVGDVRMDGMDSKPMPEVFRPMAQLPTESAWLVVRTRGDAGSVVDSLRRVLYGIDPEIAIVEISTMTSMVGDSLWRERFSALLIGLFAMFAVLIASGGLYAVISHAVQRRMQELGVRVALGATGLQIARTVLGHGLRVSAFGIAIGTLLTIMAGRLVAQQDYEMRDLPWMFAAIASFLLLLTLLACWLPLRRALDVDPATTLRAE
ncbi:MAG TPA: ABC transporter permease [Bryobacteraceae bacterium]|nr:ABC transporter permease [Bryobacteraceae bacterium]